LTPAKPLRLDAELVRRGLARSRAEAKRAIEEGRVEVRGVPVLKATAQVRADAPVVLAPEPAQFVSRGGLKLDAALRRFGIDVAGRSWLDAGASTGGFTDRLLQGGAARVAAVDVGYGQLHWRLRNDPRVSVVERTNVRRLQRSDVPFPVDGVVADLSFISLRLVVPVLASVAEPHADHVLLVKPQFELARSDVGGGGVVKDPALWKRALRAVAEAASKESLTVVDAAPASPPGPAGNREFFLWLRRDATPSPGAIDRAVEEAER
jgi:23S rRNA (cytidine1920-2'-O)/16S rRNA (cytidine1409-2'-O)-methyltransferase